MDFSVGDIVTTPAGAGRVIEISSGDPAIDVNNDGFVEVYARAEDVGTLRDGQQVTVSGFQIERRAANKATNEYVLKLEGETIGRYRSLDYAKSVAMSHSPEDFPRVLAGDSTPEAGATERFRAGGTSGSSSSGSSSSGSSSSGSSSSGSSSSGSALESDGGSVMMPTSNETGLSIGTIVGLVATVVAVGIAFLGDS